MDIQLPILLVVAVVALHAPQTTAAPSPGPANPASATIHFGFTYHLPEDWQVTILKPTAPAQPQNEEKQTANAETKRGIACTEVPMTARHGEPPTVIDIVVLPFACYGQTMNGDQLPGFGAGAALGLKKVFDISLPITATYTLAGHRMWIERARAVPLGKTAPAATLEIVCTLLKQSAVCWLAQAADEAGLRIFESAPVTLDADPAPALVPHDVFLHHK